MIGKQYPDSIGKRERQATVNISEGQNDFPALVKAAEKGQVVTVTRHGKSVACVVGHERMSAIVETLEIMANPDAMKAIRDHKAGKLKSHSIDEIPE